MPTLSDLQEVSAMKNCSDASTGSGPSHDSVTSRRNLLKTIAAVGAGAILPAAGLIAQNAKKNGAGGNPRRIDVHHQYSFVRDGNYGTGRSAQAPMDSLAQMEKHGIATAIISP